MESPQSDNNNYFTYLPNNFGGFTHQLLRFHVAYKLGLSLGYHYIHTPLHSLRSSSNIYHFLGFNEQFKYSIKDICLDNFIFLDISIAKIVQKFNLDILQELQDKIKTIVLNKRVAAEKQLILRIDSAALYNQNTKNLLEEKLLIPRKIKSQILNLPDNLNLRFNYDQVRKKYPVALKRPDGRIKILVHIRQGDTALLETPWKTFIRPLKFPGRKFQEVKTISDIKDNYVNNYEYFIFISSFLNFFNEKLSVCIHSDGFKRAFKKICNNCHYLSWTDNQYYEFKNSEKDYDQKKFALFKHLNDCKCIVGESDENLFDLIHSSLNSDIIISGTNQKMMLKLLSFYGDKKKSPILIVLYKNKKLLSKKLKNVNWNDSKAKLIPFRLYSDNIKSLAKKVKQAIIHKV